MNRFSAIICLIIGFSTLLRCSEPLERQHVPVFAGISIDSTAACPMATLTENRSIQVEAKLDGWSVEIPMLIRTDDLSNSFVYYEGHTLDTLIHLLQEQNIPYFLNFFLQNPFSYKPEEISTDKYLTDVSGLLLRASDYPPEVIGFMGSFLDQNLMGDKLQVLVAELRKALPLFSGQIVYAGVPEVLERAEFDWNTPDAIGVVYLPPEPDEIKPHFREINQHLSTLLQRHQKPVYILQSNLVGDEKLIVFKNQLRFWNDAVDLQGIVLNSLYCHISLSDSTSPFSLKGDQAFGTYLKTYLSK